MGSLQKYADDRMQDDRHDKYSGLIFKRVNSTISRYAQYGARNHGFGTAARRDDGPGNKTFVFGGATSIQFKHTPAITYGGNANTKDRCMNNNGQVMHLTTSRPEGLPEKKTVDKELLNKELPEMSVSYSYPPRALRFEMYKDNKEDKRLVPPAPGRC